jgi:hypothetical protein
VFIRVHLWFIPVVKQLTGMHTMKRRWKILIALEALLLLLAASLFLTMHIQPAGELDAYKQSLRAKGELLEISQVIPPPVPAASNGLSLVQSAFGCLGPADDESNEPPAMQMVAFGKAMVGWAQPNLVKPGSYGFTNSWANAQQVVDEDGPLLDLLRLAGHSPALDFQLDYSQGFAVLLPHLEPLRHCARRLSAATLCQLHAGHTAAAVTNVCTLLALIHNNHNERMVLSQLVRFKMDSIASSATWEVLQATNLTDADLAALQRGWTEQEFAGSAEGSLMMERASMEMTIQKMRSSGAELSRGLGFALPGTGGASSSGDWLEALKDTADNAKGGVAKFMWRTSWSYADERQTLEALEILLEADRTAKTNYVFFMACTNMEARLKAMDATNTAGPLPRALSVPDLPHLMFSAVAGLGVVVHKAMQAETEKQVAITAIALRRFQLRHGELPGQLAELTPEFLPTVPLDPVDGKPLRYHPNGDGTFLLYSVGEDGVDDGGNPTHASGTSSGSSFVYNRASLFWQNPIAIDWVWPQPATPAEVQFFRDHPPK